MNYEETTLRRRKNLSTIIQKKQRIRNVDTKPSNSLPPAPYFLNSHHFYNNPQLEDKASLSVSKGWYCCPVKLQKWVLVTEGKPSMCACVERESEMVLYFCLHSSIAMPLCTSSVCLEWTRAHDKRMMHSFLNSSEGPFSASWTSCSHPYGCIREKNK